MTQDEQLILRRIEPPKAQCQIVLDALRYIRYRQLQQLVLTGRFQLIGDEYREARQRCLIVEQSRLHRPIDWWNSIPNTTFLSLLQTDRMRAYRQLQLL